MAASRSRCISACCCSLLQPNLSQRPLPRPSPAPLSSSAQQASTRPRCRGRAHSCHCHPEPLYALLGDAREPQHEAQDLPSKVGEGPARAPSEAERRVGFAVRAICSLHKQAQQTQHLWGVLLLSPLTTDPAAQRHWMVPPPPEHHALCPRGAKRVYTRVPASTRMRASTQLPLASACSCAPHRWPRAGAGFTGYAGLEEWVE